ncbi:MULTISPECIES: DUF2808 domain-containing protein [unclassified Moorena]|uniref:DUF2808 domain-containing protein n=1 Tax=unclassified Moorena TaxID=2683338 RepID=UPI0013BA1D5A|nr:MULTISPECIES: DUF2808 domain-containing protein [unclassified Moorena]NEP34360.1 DUF2808 domain-containing protein [Moorena sp. SIO3B2]NEQ06664.1 DUF2808 domain-containing protein [Moorena sp. SIO4E2]NET64385.1 DUF2808 domain-containing protein [Moorena sp. SIO1G6]
MTNNIARWGLTKARLVGSGAFLLGILLPTTLYGLPAKTIEIGNGKTVFNRAPRLVRAATSFTRVRVPSTYQFTLRLPEDAGESLQAVTITQNKTNIEKVKFDPRKSRGFVGDTFAGGSSLTLANIGGSESSNSDQVTVVFDPPVAPGQTITVSVRAKENPEFSGSYLFGVTAFSTGENSPGLFLGSRRLFFDEFGD